MFIMNDKTKILLTGGSGFIGKNILEQLGDKYIFLAPSRQELDLKDSETVFTYLKNEAVDLVLHLANIGGSRKQSGLENVAYNNLLIYFNLIKAKSLYKRLIVLGSGAEYDKRGPIKSIKENEFDKKIPVDQYGFSKYVMSKYAEQTDYITHLRLFAVFGKYEDYEIRFISNSICKALFDLPITIKKNVFFDYLHINDFVGIIDKFLEHSPKNIHYNVGSGQPIDLLSLAKIILKVIGKDLPIQIAQSGLNNEYTCDITKLKEEFPEIKYTVLEDSIKSLVLYYQKILPTLDKNLFLYDK